MDIFIDRTNNSLKLYVSNADRLSATGFTTDVWRHVAFVKNNNKTYLFVNGVSASTVYTDTNNYLQPMSGISIGNRYNPAATAPFSGGLEDIRITKGIARYTSNFTPPAKLAANYTDPYFNNVILFISGNYIGGFNKHFRATKASSGLVITASSGAPHQGSHSPFFPNGWSNLFDGLSSYISPTTSVPLLTSNTQPFTFETWFYRVKKTKAGANTAQCIFGSYQDSSNGFNIRIDEGVLTICNGDPSIPNLPTVNIKENVWYHLAISGKPGTSLKFFLNGVLQGETSSAVGMTGNNAIVIGNLQKVTSSNPDWCFSGYISNLRFIQGLELYTSDFTPPKQKLQKIEGNGISTVILACQDGIYKDKGSNNFTMGFIGNPSTIVFNPLDKTEEYSPNIHGGSLYVDGNNTYIQYGANMAQQKNFEILPYIDFTIEFFVNLKSNTGNQKFFNTNGSTALYLSFNNGRPGFYDLSGPLVSNTKLATNTWYHIVFTRQHNTRRIFINGVLDTSGTHTGTYTYGSIRIGVDYGGPASYASGYITNVRFVKGTSLYTTNFTPPTGILTAVKGTSLLLNFDNANLIDNSGNLNITFSLNPTINTSDLAPISSSTGSIDFGNNTTLNTLQVFSQNPNLFAFRNDYTIEMWVKQKWTAAGGANTVIISNQTSLNQSTPFIFLGIQNGILRFANAVGSNRITSAIVPNVWHHVALSRESKTYRMFIDGNLVGSYTEPTLTVSLGDRWNIGDWYTSLNPFFGLMDNIRIHNGKAIYTKNFTPITTL